VISQGPNISRVSICVSLSSTLSISSRERERECKNKIYYIMMITMCGESGLIYCVPKPYFGMQYYSIFVQVFKIERAV
jgi:hypothetical protein